MTLQNANAQIKKPKFQSVDRVKAPAEGQAGATRRCRQVPHKCWVFAALRPRMIWAKKINIGLKYFARSAYLFGTRLFFQHQPFLLGLGQCGLSFNQGLGRLLPFDGLFGKQIGVGHKFF